MVSSKGVSTLSVCGLISLEKMALSRPIRVVQQALRTRMSRQKTIAFFFNDPTAS